MLDQKEEIMRSLTSLIAVLFVIAGAVSGFMSPES
jgi:hypothetical protein